jgi:hypothetical protein
VDNNEERGGGVRRVRIHGDWRWGSRLLRRRRGVRFIRGVWGSIGGEGGVKGRGIRMDNLSGSLMRVFRPVVFVIDGLQRS